MTTTQPGFGDYRPPTDEETALMVCIKDILQRAASQGGVHETNVLASLESYTGHTFDVQQHKVISHALGFLLLRKEIAHENAAYRIVDNDRLHDKPHSGTFFAATGVKTASVAQTSSAGQTQRLAPTRPYSTAQLDVEMIDLTNEEDAEDADDPDNSLKRRVDHLGIEGDADMPVSKKRREDSLDKGKGEEMLLSNQTQSTDMDTESIVTWIQEGASRGQLLDSRLARLLQMDSTQRTPQRTNLGSTRVLLTHDDIASGRYHQQLSPGYMEALQDVIRQSKLDNLGFSVFKLPVVPNFKAFKPTLRPMSMQAALCLVRDAALVNGGGRWFLVEFQPRKRVCSVWDSTSDLSEELRQTLIGFATQLYGSRGWTPVLQKIPPPPDMAESGIQALVNLQARSCDKQIPSSFCYTKAREDMALLLSLGVQAPAMSAIPGSRLSSAIHSFIKTHFSPLSPTTRSRTLIKPLRLVFAGDAEPITIEITDILRLFPGDSPSPRFLSDICRLYTHQNVHRTPYLDGHRFTSICRGDLSSTADDAVGLLSPGVSSFCTLLFDKPTFAGGETSADGLLLRFEMLGMPSINPVCLVYFSVNSPHYESRTKAEISTGIQRGLQAVLSNMPARLRPRDIVMEACPLRTKPNSEYHLFEDLVEQIYDGRIPGDAQDYPNKAENLALFIMDLITTAVVASKRLR